jgi:hypothetical protein
MRNLAQQYKYKLVQQKNSAKGLTQQEYQDEQAVVVLEIACHS